MRKSLEHVVEHTKDKSYHFAKVMVLFFGTLLVFSIGKGLVEQYAPIYKKPWNFQAEVIDGHYVFSALSQKMLPCSVVPGSTVSISVMYLSPSGNLIPKGYTALKPGEGMELRGKPLIRFGESFVVGPWEFKEPLLDYDNIYSIAVVLQCAFPSGIVREAVIGPIYPGDKNDE